jgi:hypothetical protein
MSSLQENWNQLTSEQERMLFLLASFFPERAPIALWLLGMVAGMDEPEEASEALKQACRHLQALGVFEEMTDEHVKLSDRHRQ